MANYKVEYEFKTDSLKRKYALKVNLVTGKRERVNYDLAHKRQVANISRHKREKIKEEIKTEGVTNVKGEPVKYAKYIKEYKSVEKKIISDRIKKEKPPLTPGALKAGVKKIVITQKLGIRTRFNYAWTWVVKIYYKDEDGKIKFDCDTNNFKAGGRAFNGNHFEDFIEIVKDAFNRIPDKKDLCYLDGGSCVTLYNKSDKTLINKFQQGRGCGFSFDFKNYENDNNMIDEQDIVDL